MLPDSIEEKLNNLIQINIDASAGYRDAASAVSDADLQNVFNTCSKERQKYADALTGQVNRHGADPETDGSFKASLHRTWMTFKADITSNNELTVVEECIRGEEAAVETYEEAISGSIFTPRIMEMIIRQHLDIKKTLTQLNEWKVLLEKKTMVS